MYEENMIIKDARVLKGQFIPSRVVHREGQLDTIRNCLKPIVKELDPRNMFLYGAPGTGKTCISMYVAEELAAHTASVKSSYINCWECSSRFKILYSILQDMGHSLRAHRKGTPTDELLEGIKTRLKERFCVIILDEVDKLEDERVLYDLANISRVCLILISNTETALHRVDPRIRSRLASSEQIEFRTYSEGEILDILKDRREWGLLPGVISNEQLKRIASSCDGDSRVGINTLRIVAEDAENQDMEKIPDSLIDKALPKAMQGSAERSMEMIPSHQRLLLEILGKGRPMDGGELFKEYARMAPKKGMPAIVDRTFRKYMERLIQVGLVTSEGNARWKIYSLKAPNGTAVPGTKA